jgi:hypothetical protein
VPIDPSIYANQIQPKFNTPFETLGQLGQLRQQQAATQAAQALEDERRQTIAINQRKQQQEETLDKIMATGFKEDPDSGIFTFDRATVEQGMLQGGLGHNYPAMAAHLDALDTSARKRAEDGRLMGARTLVGIGDAGYTPESLLSGAAYLLKNQVMTKEKLQPVLDAANADPSPDNIKRIVTTLGAGIPQYQDLLKGEEKRQAELAKMRTEAGFTLTPGQIRFDPEGTELARGGDKERTAQEQELDAFAKTVNKTKAEELTYPERQLFERRKLQAAADVQASTHQRERDYDNAHPAPPPTPDQAKLYQQGATLIRGALSNRSGGVGLEHAKVLQANHLLSLLEQSYDPKTDDYKIPNTQYNELALGLAKLVAPGGVVGEGMMEHFQDATAKGDLAKILKWATGNPVPANTQSLTKYLKDSIVRQGQTAAQNRENDMAAWRGLLSPDLDAERRQRLEAVELGPLRQSRVIQNPATGERRLQVSVDGGQSWK